MLDQKVMCLNAKAEADFDEAANQNDNSFPVVKFEFLIWHHFCFSISRLGSKCRGTPGYFQQSSDLRI